MQARFLPLGDSAVTVEFGDRIDQTLVASVAALDERLSREKEAGRLPGIVETMPTYRSLTVIFDPGLISWSALKRRILKLMSAPLESESRSASSWRLPVCYHADYGPDLEQVASARGLTPAQVVELHVSQSYIVYMIGFLPGFPFMGDVLPALDMPRLREPRTRVPAGSVAITGQQTAIYPWESPGGWNILGRCPLPLFDAQRTLPALLGPGDRVSFEMVSPERYEELARAAREQSLDLAQFRTGGNAHEQ
jgi:inhibitor of KinA